MSAIAPQIRTKTEYEQAPVTFGFAIKLGTSGTTLTGTPTVVSIPSGLTIAAPTINSSTITVDGITHTAGQAVQALVSGGTLGVKYVLSCKADGTPQGKFQMLAALIIEDDPES